jgi:hypothetical protein
MSMAKWWLISWTTYGSWLPGDPRGYCTWRGEQYVPPPKRYAKAGEPTYQASAHATVHTRAKTISDEAVYLTREEIEIALSAMMAEIAQIPIVPAIMSVGDWHVHWQCYFGPLEIRPVVSRVKAAATRELNTHGFQGKKPWTKGCNMRSKATRQACQNAYRYVGNHREQGCLIYEWSIDPKYLVFENERPPTSRRLG